MGGAEVQKSRLLSIRNVHYLNLPTHAQANHNRGGVLLTNNIRLGPSGGGPFSNMIQIRF